MADCSYCGTRIWFGGRTDGKFRFCNADCHQRGVLLSIADQVPKDVLQTHIDAVHKGTCPRCNGPGPVDVHNSYRVWSALVLTSWRTRAHICCKSCARKSQLGDTTYSLFLGWWGVPWGLIMTPIQIGKNIGGLAGGPDAARATPQLEKLIKLDLARRMVDHHQRTQAAQGQAQGRAAG